MFLMAYGLKVGFSSVYTINSNFIANMFKCVDIDT